MYGWIWRTLPGGLPGKLVGSLVLLLAAVALLFFVVFPAVEPLLPLGDVTVDGEVSSTTRQVPTPLQTPVPSASAVP